MRHRRIAILALSLAAAYGAHACGGAGPPVATAPDVRVTVEKVAEYPHDPAAFTQGLELYDGRLFESTGLRARSSLREVERETGKVVRMVELASDLFGEGLTRVEDRWLQLTWTAGVALVYDAATLELIDRKEYAHQGWGLCYDGRRLIMSNGTDALAFRDPGSFKRIGNVHVTYEGEPVDGLNELECVGDVVYANVFRTDLIAAIEPATGRVTAMIDASELRAATGRPAGDVLNGIAYDDERGTFLLTGKRWPSVFEVRFVAREFPAKTGTAGVPDK